MKRQKIPSDADIRKVIDYIARIPLNHQIRPEEFGYSNPVLICLDAVLSINRRYYSFVVPRIKHFQKTYPNICTLQQISTLIQDLGYEGFCVVWKYKHIARVRTLDHLVTKFINYAKEIGETDDLTAMKIWARESSVTDYKNFGVPGIGLATFQYLRMMLGVSTVKPDVHIKRAVSDALKRPVSDIEAIILIEKASEAMGLPATLVDHNLWRHFAFDASKDRNAQ